jgi:hypothetical protein
VGEVVDATGRKAEPILRDIEAAGIGNSGHFDGRLGAIQERVEHLCVHASQLCLLGGESVMCPDIIGGDSVIVGQVFGSFACCRYHEACRASPIDHLGDQCRLVTLCHGVDDTALAGLLGQQGACQHIGLDVDHDDVLTRLKGRQRMPDPCFRMAGCFDHYLHVISMAGL